MSMTHTLSRALGAAALAASLATAGSAGAAEGGADRPAWHRADDAPRHRMAEPAGDPAPALAASRRSIYSEVAWRNDRLYLRGDVEAYSGREVLVQRKACSSCRWRAHDVVTTGKKGWFRSVIGAPRHGSTFWRARVAASDGYLRSFSATWETYY